MQKNVNNWLAINMAYTFTYILVNFYNNQDIIEDNTQQKKVSLADTIV